MNNIPEAVHGASAAMEADETWPALQRRFSCLCLYDDFFIFQIRNSKITSRLLSGGPLPRASREACAKFLLLVLACAFHQKPADEPSRWFEKPQYLLPHKKVKGRGQSASSLVKRIAVDRFTEFFNPFVTYPGQTGQTWPVSTGEKV